MRRTAARLLGGLVVFILIGWGAGELWSASIGSSEIELMRELASRRSESLAEVSRVVTWAGSGFILVPLALLSCALLLREGLRAQALAVALSLGGAMVISEVVKSLVARPRPGVEHLQAVSSFSFPSGHSMQASAFWLSLLFAAGASRALPGRTAAGWAAALVIIALVAASRVYLGVHYPSDVIAGVLLGGAWAIFVAASVTPRVKAARSETAASSQ